MQRYVWIPKEPPFIFRRFTPPSQPPLPKELRFTTKDVVFEKKIDWWAPDAPYPYVDPRELCKKSNKATPDVTFDCTDGTEGPALPHEEGESITETNTSPEVSESIQHAELSVKEKRRLAQIRRRNKPSGRITQHQRRNDKRYKKKNIKKMKARPDKLKR